MGAVKNKLLLKEEKQMVDKAEKQMKECISLMGWKSLQSYDKLWGTVFTTWGRKDSSMWFVSFCLDDNWNVVSYEVNSTYFKISEEIKQKLTTLINSYQNGSVN